MFSCEYCETFKNTHFEEHQRTDASISRPRLNQKHNVEWFILRFVDVVRVYFLLINRGYSKLYAAHSCCNIKMTLH